MSVTYIISVFVRELPGCILFGWIFMSVALFLLMLITYFRIQLSEAKTEQNRKRRWATDPKVDKELAMLHDPRNTLLDYRTERQKLGRSGKKVNKCRN
ncbi:small leucine-rich protein 1 isoform X1 [Anas platyrhynchos]|uniref:small leucine-rich protein 1 isoform X1 n=1 Tax=Anas platyrhynchos TaxID=8839 RepID=UPI003AF2026C